MSDALTIDEINALIEQHSDRAKQAVSQLADYCQQDSRCRTPLNIAVQSYNHDIVSVLAESEEAINFSPSIDADLLSPAKHSVGSIFLGDNVEETEEYLLQSFGSHSCWQRTPLHTACRHGDADSIALLISKNAGLDTKDIMGLTPLDLCLQFCETETIDRFTSCCTEHKRKLGITEQALMSACANTGLYDRLMKFGALNIKARRFAFSRACALLDKEGIEALLGQGLDINKTMNDEFSPIMEVCTSRLLFLYEHPDAPRLAGQHAAAQEAGAGGIRIDNDAILNAESLDDLEALFSNSIEDAENKHAKQTAYALSDKERQSQLALRIELIDYLVEQGLDTGIAQEKAPFAFLDHIASMNSPEIHQALLQKGFLLAPEHQADVARSGVPKPSQKKVTKRVKAVRKTEWTWELAGESMLFAQTEPKCLAHTQAVIVRVTHNNVYGPVDDAELYVRIGNPDIPTVFDDLDGGSEWYPLVLVEELLTVDGDEVDRSSLEEPIYVETPWEATYECELKFAPGKRSIEIRVVSEIEGLSAVISDWIVEVK